MPNDPITLQEMPGVRARTYQDLVRYLMDRVGQAVAPAGMSLSDVLANAGDVAGFGHRANMGLVNTGTEDRPLWIPRPGADFDPSGSAFVRNPAAPAIEERIATMGKMRDANARNMGISRRNFMKAIPGGALAVKSLLSGEGKVIESQIPKMMEQAAQKLGESPVRVYERVGNKFILTHEVPTRIGPAVGEVDDYSGYTIWESDKDIIPAYKGLPYSPSGKYSPDNAQLITSEGKVMLSRPGRSIRPVIADIDHPEHKLLAEPNSVVDRYVAPKGADPESLAARATGSDPYHARYARSKDLVNQRLEGLIKSFVKPDILPNMTPEQIEAWQGLYGKHPNEGGVVVGMDVGPHVPNTYIIEKPVRVRYIEQGWRKLGRLEQEGKLVSNRDFDEYERSIHPEVWKLPLEHRGNIIHEFGEALEDDAVGNNAPRLIGSGDTYQEAHSKADSFLRDIGIEPGTINWSGAKVRRATLPNGDIIEIRERPSLRPGYTPEKAGYRNKKK